MSKPSITAPRTSTALRESCADLIRRLRQGESPRAEQYLAQFPYLAADAEAAVELIYTEFATREELGSPASAAEFYARFPERRAALQRQFDIHRLLGEGLPIDADDDATASPSVADVSAADMPRRLGAYEILRPLGHGGMGRVYLGRHVELGRPAALKILAARRNDAGLAERFRAEVRAAAALGHPQIVQLYELGETSDGRPFAAFEYVEGGTLHQAIGGRPRPARAAAELLLQLAEATACAHRAGIVHCDLTSANVLMVPGGGAKIADFGLARLLRNVAADMPADDARPGDANTGDDDGSALAGTPGYMAPERIEHADVATPAVDVYGLGAVFFELLTGRPPLVGATPLETLRRARDEDPPSPRAVVPSVARDAATICLKCLARDPQRRYVDAAALAVDLRRFLAGEPIAARPVGTAERAWKWAQRRPGATAALVIAFAALAIAAVGGTWYNLRLREALDRTAQQEQQIRLQAGRLTEQLDRVQRNIYTLQLNQAEALVDRAPHQALALLKDEQRSPPERRDFAWGLLVRRASPDRATLVGHDAAIGAIAWTPEGLVTAGADDAAILWNDDATPRTTFRVATAGARRQTLSPNGRRLAATFDDRTIRTWDLSTREPFERLLVGHTGQVTALAYFPDGRWLASADNVGRVIVWDPSGRAVAVWNAVEGGAATSLAISPDGSLVAVGGGDGVVRLLDAIDGRVRGELYGHIGGVAALSFTAGGKQLAAVGVLGGKITLWDLVSRTEATSIDPAGGVVVALAVNEAGTRLAYATTDHDLRVVDVADGAVLAEYRGHADRIEALAFDETGAILASASADRTAKLWDVPGRKLTTAVAGDDQKTLVVAFAPDGATLATAGHDGTIRLSNVDDEREVRQLVGHEGAVRAIRFTADGSRLLSCGEDSTVRLWNLADGELVRAWEHPTWVVDAALIGRDEFLSIGTDGTMRRFRLSGEQPTATVAPPSTSIAPGTTIHMAATSPDGKVAALMVDGAIHVVDAVRGVAIVSSRRDRTTTSLAFSPDGRTLAAGDAGGVVELWHYRESGSPLSLRGHSRGVYSLAFSPDGRILASASGGRWVQLGGETKLWDVATGQVHAMLDGATAPLAFSADGRRLAVSDDAQRLVRIWTAAPYATPPTDAAPQN